MDTEPDSDNRKVCSFCGQELAHTAFSRHQGDKTGRVCPGKRELVFETVSYSENEPSSLVSADLDTTFDLGSSDDAEVTHDIDHPCVEDCGMSDTDSNSTSSSFTLSSSDGEFWDAPDEIDEPAEIDELDQIDLEEDTENEDLDNGPIKLMKLYSEYLSFLRFIN